jgi:hypothetical protein
MNANDITTFLSRANAFAYGEIKGDVPATMDTQNLKTAVAMAFEIFAKGETAQVAQVNVTTGNITDAAPAGKMVQKTEDPFKVVKAMLVPYAQAVLAGNASKSDRGIRFL